MENPLIIFSEDDLKGIPEKAIKSLLTFILTSPKLNKKIVGCILPEIVLDDKQFTQQIMEFLNSNKIKIGISMQTKYIRKDEGNPFTQDFCWNLLPIIKNYIQQYPLIEIIHVTFPFGKRRIQKSPKYDEYILHSQFNWTNIALIQKELKQKILVEPLLYFYENSSEDSYIHMRQILWDGIETLRRLGGKIGEIDLLINPFYPNIRRMKEIDVANISNTTLRCLMEVLSKEKPTIYLRSCEQMGIYSYGRYLKVVKDYNKNLDIRWMIGRELIKDFMDIWQGKQNNVEEAQKKLNGGIDELTGA